MYLPRKMGVVPCVLAVSVRIDAWVRMPREEDARKFEQILGFWRRRCPGASFTELEGHTVDGPRRRSRIHIPVPCGIEHLYRHPFSRAFLEQRARGKAGLEGYVATDLLALRRGILSTADGVTVTIDEKHAVACMDYAAPLAE